MRLIAIVCGGDGQLLGHIKIPDDLDLEAAKAQWKKWLEEKYAPSRYQLPYLDFPDWLLKNSEAILATEEDVEECLA